MIAKNSNKCPCHWLPLVYLIICIDFLFHSDHYWLRNRGLVGFFIQKSSPRDRRGDIKVISVSEWLRFEINLGSDYRLTDQAHIFSFLTLRYHFFFMMWVLQCNTCLSITLTFLTMCIFYSLKSDRYWVSLSQTIHCW